MNVAPLCYNCISPDWDGIAGLGISRYRAPYGADLSVYIVNLQRDT